MEATVVGRRASATAAVLRLERRGDGGLWAIRDDVARAVWVRRCFPWSEPARFVSLRDDADREFALVRDPAELDPASRRVLEDTMLGAGFVFAITRVRHIEEEVEIRNWQVDTRQGPRSFQTRLDAWPRLLPDGGLLIRDVAGDLYHLADLAALDKQSRALLWAFVD